MIPGYLMQERRLRRDEEHKTIVPGTALLRVSPVKRMVSAPTRLRVLRNYITLPKLWSALPAGASRPARRQPCVTGPPGNN